MRSAIQLLLCAALIYGVAAQPPPPSPYGRARKICPARIGARYSVEGFPGTPFPLNLFKDTFANPPELAAEYKNCRADGHCMSTHLIDVYDHQLKPFNNIIPSCAAKPGTWFLTYNGVAPGPTIITPAGHETIVRYNNKIGVGPLFTKNVKPCDAAGRTGHPFSVHLHGSASLAPYDGWAEDETCLGETKDYVFPNNRPVTGWYHDHALHITARNAYYGLAGMYHVSDKVKHNGCGAPWNLEDVEELHMILQDKILDTKCQLGFDEAKAHKDNFYGDINLVSGIPFPLMKLEPKYYRMRLLNAAISRTYKLKVKNAQMQDVSQNICHVIAGDGGYRFTPVTFPANGLLIGVAERYEIVCDFSAYKGQTLYIFNEKDDKLNPGVPFFCFSHLVAKIVVATATSSPAPAFNPAIAPQPNQPLEKVMSGADYAAAVAMAKAGKFHRELKFGRRKGHWVINGETWESFKIAAADVGQNTWEVWKLKTGGGWHHPVHIHLIDFFIVRRDGADGVRSYEELTPKDVMYLGNGDTLYVIARFGAHRGDYMFHCHNLRHEDNDMMRAYRIVNGDQGKNAASAAQYMQINGIVYDNFDYADPMGAHTAATLNPPVWGDAYSKAVLDKNIYRIFYPNATDSLVLDTAINPWKAKWPPGQCA